MLPGQMKRKFRLSDLFAAVMRPLKAITIAASPEAKSCIAWPPLSKKSRSGLIV